MKKTEYQMMTRFKTWNPVYRRVWTDGERFFVKDEGKIWDVTDKKDKFQKDWR